MRTRATIATHRADKLQFPLHYCAVETSRLQITPLGKQECSAISLIERLKEEREALKQKKKRQPKTGLYR